MAYFALEPFGSENEQHRGDLRAGIIASTVYNTQRGKDSKALSPKDFMPEIKIPFEFLDDDYDEIESDEKPKRTGPDPKAVMTGWFAPRVVKKDGNAG